MSSGGPVSKTRIEAAQRTSDPREARDSGSAQQMHPAAEPPAGGTAVADRAAGNAAGPRPSASAAAEARPAAPSAAPEPAPLGEAAERLWPRAVRLKEAADDSIGAPTDVRVSSTTAAEPAGDGRAEPGLEPALGPLFAVGTRILDSAGAPTLLRGLSWFGLESDISAPHGLWARNWRAIMDDVKALGFDTLRIPFSGELVASGGGTPNGIDPTLNPDLVGLDGLQILDRLVEYAGRIGLRVILDYHRGPPGSGPNENGLWFGAGRTEADVIEEWRTMAERYADAPAVIGADLVNEPFMATWGDGSATDWAAAAERIGNAVQAIAPHWLILVQGVAAYDGETYWWGGNLQGVRERPVRLDVPDKLVYSPHDYPASVHPQDWFFDGTDLEQTFRENWGYIVEEGIAPVLVGEWGSRLETDADALWARTLTDYMARLDVSWLWWSLNPNSQDTGGIFADDWTTPREPVLDLLAPDLEASRSEFPFDAAEQVAGAAVFTVRLGAFARDELTLTYATRDGTARAGADYEAAAGTLTFRAGESEANVSVPVLPDGLVEGNEFFYLLLGASGAVQASGTAVIADTDQRRTAAGPPFVDAAGTVVTEAAGVALFRVVLSDAAREEVRIDFATRAETAAGEDFEAARGELVIPAGEREATLEVAIEDDDRPEPAERFTLELTAAEGARIREGLATALVAAEPPAAAEIAVAPSATAATQLTIDLILQKDWGSGALFEVAITNVSEASVSQWQLAMDLPFDLAELWSAVLVGDEGTRVTVRNAQWNGTIAAGETVEFGFVAEVGGIELGSLLAAADLELAVQ